MGNSHFKYPHTPIYFCKYCSLTFNKLFDLMSHTCLYVAVIHTFCLHKYQNNNNSTLVSSDIQIDEFTKNKVMIFQILQN